MPSTCFVRGCKSGYKNKKNEGKKWHFFHPPDPKDSPEAFALWKKNCYRDDIELKISHSICHEHFPEEMLIKGVDIKLTDGSVYHSDYSKWRKTPDAYPCLFDNCPEILSLLGVKRKQAGRGRRGGRRTQAPSSLNVGDCQKKDCNVLPLGESKAVKPKVAEPVAVDKGIQVDFTTTACYNAKKLYRKWKKRCYNLKASVAKKLAKSVEKRPGVFVPFENLSEQEKMFAMTLARKANMKRRDGRGMRYTSRQLIEALNLAAQDKKSYILLRSKIQALPHIRTLRRFQMIRSNKNESNSSLLQLMKDGNLEGHAGVRIDDASKEDEIEGNQNKSLVPCNTAPSE